MKNHLRLVGGGAPPDPGRATGALGRGAGKAKGQSESRNGADDNRDRGQSLYRRRPAIACMVRRTILRCGGAVRR